MPKQPKFIGFDSKCEDCGNYYASDYIEFHKTERCLKKPFNSENYPEFQQQLKKTKKEKSVERDGSPNAERKPFVMTKNQDIISTALKEIRRKKEILSPCPHCKVNVKQIGLNKHFSKCPVLKLKIISQKNTKKKILIEKLSSCQYCSLKLKTNSLQKHISTFHSAILHKPQKVKNAVKTVACSNCGAWYTALTIKCPQCECKGTKIKALAPINRIYKCRQCGRQSMYATSNCQSCGDK